MACRGIIFDFDGTLANTTPLILATFHKTLDHFYPQLGTKDRDIINTFGLPLREGLAKLAGIPAEGQEIETMTAYYRTYNNAWHDAMIRPFPGVKEGLALLKEKQIPMVAVTSKLHDSCLRGLRCLGLASYIDAIIGCEQCTAHKPDPEPMRKGCEALGILPEEVLSVGDSPFDMLSGRRAGCKTVKVGWTSFSRDFFDRYGAPDYVIETLGDLVPLMAKQQ